MKKILRNKHGEGYIDTAVSVIVIMMLIALALDVFSFLTLKQDMDYFAREMVKSAAVHGTYSSSEVYDRYYDLGDEVGFYPSFSWKTNYNNGRVQYGEPIEITLTYKTSLSGFGILKIPITLTASYSGLSQKYWK